MPISNPSATISFPDPQIHTIAPPATEVDVTDDATMVVPASNDRKGLTIVNSHFTSVYFDVQSTVSNSIWMFVLAPGAFYEMPQPVFTNAIYATTSNGGDGKLHIREITVL